MKTQTSATQIGITLFLFQLGSTPLFLLGGTAKQDVWISMTLASVVGLLLLCVHLQIYQLNAKHDIYEILIHTFGKIVGGGTALVYVVYFFYDSVRIVRDLGELVSVTLLNRTPMPVVLFAELAVIAFVTQYGPRVFFRFCGVFLYVVLLAYLVIFSLILVSGLIHFEFMLPVMENGFKPIIDPVPDLVAFPFGQTILFLSMFKYATSQQKLKKTILWSYTLVSILVIIINQVVVLVLGPVLATTVTYPLYTVVQLIQVGSAIERSDVLFTLILFIGLVIKISLYYIAISIGLQRVLKIKYKVWIKILMIPLLLVSLRFSSYVSFMFGEPLYTITLYSYLVIQIAVPVCLLTVMLIKRKYS